MRAVVTTEKGPWSGHAFVRPAIVVLIVVVLLLAASWLGQRKLIYFPTRSAPVAPMSVREVALRTSDGLSLAAWLVPATGTDRGLAVLVAPGNGGNRGDRTALADGLAGLGLTVLLLDYRGYGGNPGQPTEEGLARDARAGLAYLTGAGYGQDRIVYFGESLGAAVVTELATAHPPAGLVLRSPFVDLASAGSHHYPFLPVRLLLRDRFPVAELIRSVTVTTTVIYGTADSIVPGGQSRTVAERAAGAVEVVEVEGADHNDPALTHGARVIGAVADLVARLTGLS